MKIISLEDFLKSGNQLSDAVKHNPEVSYPPYRKGDKIKSIEKDNSFPGLYLVKFWDENTIKYNGSQIFIKES